VNRKVDRYFIESLAGAGVAPLEHALAIFLRPDIWASAYNAAADFAAAWPELDARRRNLGAKLFAVELSARPEPLYVAARSPHMLPERFRWITGLEPVSVTPVPALVVEQKPVAPIVVPKEVPSWPCNDRANYFRENGERDPSYRVPGR
jgi:hypothetical protein